MTRIELSELAHSYSAAPGGEGDYALKPTNLVFEAGGAYALLGPSGCGKTTLLNLISGLVVPTAGRILFDGTDVSLLTTEQREIAQVFQFPVVYDTMTVYDNLAFPLRNRGIFGPALDARVREIAGMLGLTGVLARRAKGLTADAKQKISLGRGLVRPNVRATLFDEPLTVIDPHLKWQLRSQLKQLHAQLATTMIYVTHDQTEALTFADTVVVMYDGRVVQVGSPEELFERPNHTFVGYFIGSPGMNVMPAILDGRTAVVAGHPIALLRSFDAAGATRTEIGIRPEFVRLSENGEGLPVRIQRVDDVGRYKLARVTLGDLRLNVMLTEDAQISGQAARVQFDPKRLHVYADGHRMEGRA